MTAILLALAPIFLLIVCGYAIRRSKLLAESFWGPADRLTFYVLFPSLLLYRTSTADLAGLPLVHVIAALTGGITLGCLAVLATHKRLGVDGPGYTSVLQGAIRPNVYVGLGAATALYGAPGTTMAAVAIAGMTPLVNTLSVIALTRHGDNQAQAGWARVAKAVVTNPIILAVVGGMVMNLLGLRLPPVVEPLLRILGQAALPLALLSVGAGLDLAAARGAGRPVIAASAIKFLVLPLATWVICQAIGTDGLALTVAVLFAALPSSSSGYIMARQLGGDHRMLANIITIQTLAAALTLPATLLLVG